MFTKILIANRGEIAVRIIIACQEMGIASVAVYSEPDRESKHVQIADEAFLLEGQPGKAYLDMAQLIAVAKRAGAQAIHPGYGFLAENAEFAEAVEAAGLIFIGPSPDVIRKMGSKIESRRVMEAAGVPVVPGTVDPVTEPEKVKELCAKFGYPVAIKASAGGGGRGLRVVTKEAEVEQALAGAQREGASYFGSGEVYVEKYLDLPRHIEVQILGDKHGHVVHLYERDCSTQRRHQKVVEESPAPGLSEALRSRLLAAAVQAAKAIGYYSAGTVECLVSGDNFYFLEMNTRVQVEHPITEMITGIDIVKAQISIAAGEKLALSQSEIRPFGHAIECRINAEDPFKNFMPSPGTVRTYAEPSLPWVRVDSACYSGYKILPFYDSLLAKLVVWGRTREEAINRTKLALRQFKIEGVSTTIPFHQIMMENEDFLAGKIYTSYVEKEMRPALIKRREEMPAAVSASEAGRDDSCAVVRSESRNFSVEVNNKLFKVSVAELVEAGAAVSGGTAKAKSSSNGAGNSGRLLNSMQQSAAALAGYGKVLDDRAICADMNCVIKEVLISNQEKVKAGQRLVVVEAMKMETEIAAPFDCEIEEVKVAVGDRLEPGALIVLIRK